MTYDPLSASGPGTGLDHPPSYWAATAGPEPEDDGALNGDRETGIAIIGGGYTGLSTAYHFARDLGTNPVVLEANRCGWGCSGNEMTVPPPLRTALPRFPLPAFRRLGQQAMVQWYRYHDSR